MKNVLLTLAVIACLFYSCSKENKPEPNSGQGKQITGTWVWAEEVTPTPDGDVVLKDFGQTIGAGMDGKVSSEIVFNNDNTVQNIIRIKPRIEDGKWTIKNDSIEVRWNDGRVQSSAYKLIGDTMIVNMGKTTVKFVKKS